MLLLCTWKCKCKCKCNRNSLIRYLFYTPIPKITIGNKEKKIKYLDKNYFIDWKNLAFTKGMHMCGHLWIDYRYAIQYCCYGTFTSFKIRINKLEWNDWFSETLAVFTCHIYERLPPNIFHSLNFKWRLTWKDIFVRDKHLEWKKYFGPIIWAFLTDQGCSAECKLDLNHKLIN